MAWSYIAQRALTGEFLHWDLPLTRDELGWELSGAGTLKGTISPDVGHLRDETGRLILEEWSTLLYAEEDGVIRWGGILISSGFQGDDWVLEASEFGTYLHGTPYEGDFQVIGIDPVDAAKELWRHAQSFPDSDLGVEVVATPTPVRLGTPAVPEFVPDNVLAADAIRYRIQGGEGIFEDWTWIGCPAYVGAYNEHLQYEWLIAGSPDPIQFLKDYDDRYDDQRIPAVEAEPYALVWWEATDSGTEFADLAKSAPFDFAEVHNWADDGETIEHRVFIGYPRLGRRREDLAFVQGDNVTSVVTFQSDGDEYANTILGLGSGEGQASLRRETVQRDGRLRRVSVYSDKSVGSPDRMDALIAAEMDRRRGLVEVSSVDVIDHPNAPIGSWDLGDDVLITAEVPWLGEVQVWCRITGWSLTGEHTASLSLARSDSFRYGG